MPFIVIIMIIMIIIINDIIRIHISIKLNIPVLK